MHPSFEVSGDRFVQKLVDGVRRFQKEPFRQNQILFESLVNGQSPLALFITCSDSRVDPNRLTQTNPGELFIQRTAGNIVPPYDAMHGGEAATIEYAITELKVLDIIICGHSHCGAMKGLLNPAALERMPAVKSYLQYSDPAREILEENYSDVTDPELRLNLAVQENVLAQLDNLATHPAVAAACDQGKLKLHGWVYKFETGEVFSYHPEQGQFASLRDFPPPKTISSTNLA